MGGGGKGEGWGVGVETMHGAWCHVVGRVRIRLDKGPDRGQTGARQGPDRSQTGSVNAAPWQPAFDYIGKIGRLDRA